MDRISGLPDEIICHIGSFLSAKEAAFAMVLSKRWRNLFNIVSELHYDNSVENGESFVDFVDRVLLALPVTSRIRKFSLKGSFKNSEQAHINRCLCHVLTRGVLVLNLEKYVDDDDEVCSLPLEVFSCKTVSQLKLNCFGDAIDSIPLDAYLPSLKSLSLDNVKFHFHELGHCTFNTLLSASPVLEELIIDNAGFEDWKWSFSVSSPTLQRLTIRREEEYDLFHVLDRFFYKFDRLSFDTPGLVYLDYSNYVSKEYPFVNLNSLVEAKLDLRVGYDDDSFWKEEFDPMNLINALKDVEILDFTSKTMQMIYVFRKVVPVFENLFHLSVGFSNKFWFSLPILLKKSPNLKTLIIKDSLYDYSRESICPDVLSNPVQVLKIMEYTGNIENLKQMKHFLEKLSCLKLVEVHAQVNGEERVRVMDDLLMLPRASNKCKIKVKFS